MRLTQYNRKKNGGKGNNLDRGGSLRRQSERNPECPWKGLHFPFPPQEMILHKLLFNNRTIRSEARIGKLDSAFNLILV
jgi:hypothetical protein